jgi:RNA polymerase sigma-70 factor (ECF subfamily)
MSEFQEMSIADNSAITNEQQIENNWLRDKIALLPKEYREPLVLQIIGGFSGEEISKMLELNKNTVMTRLFRARNQLKDTFEKEPVMRGQYNG